MISEKIQKFLSKIVLNKDCWIWCGAKDKDLYGVTSFKGKYIKAHRLSFMLFNGDIKNKNWVLHKCDNTSCVNPDHLYQGNAFDNNRDTVKRNRRNKKEILICKNGHTVLDDNLYFSKNENKRVCKICRRNADKRRYLKNKKRMGLNYV